MKKMRPALRLAAAVIGVVLATGSFAHAMLDHALPRVGSSVHASPQRVELWFSERLEPAFSTLRVLDASGRQVDRGDATVDPSDRTHFTVSLAPLARGSYRVVWRAVSVDTHVTTGDFGFEVAP